MGGIGKHCGKTCRTGSLCKRLLMRQIAHHRAFDIRFPDEAHIVHELLADGDGALGHIFDRYAFSERRAPASRGLTPKGVVHRRIELHLDAQHFNIGLEMLCCDRNAGNDPDSKRDGRQA